MGGRQTYGLVSSAGINPVSSKFLAEYPDLRSVLSAGKLYDIPTNCELTTLEQEDFDFLPPIPAPSKIICVGLNYRKPYPVAGKTFHNDDIVIFGRHDDTLVSHAAPLEMPKGEAAATFDFEGEIVAVIGKTCRQVSAFDALSYVAGFSCMNEGSVRGWQKHSIHAGKNFFASGSWGPWLTTIDEAGPVENMTLTTRVNGSIMQQASGRDMIHSLPKIISYLSNINRLNPGDIIATGSPDGTGGSRTPPAFLKPGDVIEVEVTPVGTLRNHVAD